MIGIVKTIDGVKKIVPLDKQLVAGLDSNIPDNAILKFSNTNNRVESTGWREVVQCNGQVHSLTLAGTASSNRAIDITRGYIPNTWGTYNWECPDRDRIAIGSGNVMNGYGFKQAYGFANVACPMNDSTTILLGSVNCQKVGATSGLAMGVGVFNDFYHTLSSALAIGLSNQIHGLTDMPVECTSCNGIADSTVYGLSNNIRSAWSHVHGSANTVSGWATINIEDPETHVVTPTKIVGTMNAFGNSNILSGAGVTAIGGNNIACSALNSVLIGINNCAYGNSTDANYRYNQFLLGISNVSRGHDTVTIGTANFTNAPAATNIGHWNCVCEGAAGGLVIGNGATAYYHCGFTRSIIRSGGSGVGAGTTPATNYSARTWMVSGCGTLLDFYHAISHEGEPYGLKQSNFMGHIRLGLSAGVCAHLDATNKYSGTAYTIEQADAVYFTDGAFAFNDNVEWFLSGTNIHDNYILGNVWNYRNCPLEAHITFVTS